MLTRRESAVMGSIERRRRQLQLVLGGALRNPEPPPRSRQAPQQDMSRHRRYRHEAARSGVRNTPTHRANHRSPLVVEGRSSEKRDMTPEARRRSAAAAI